MSLLACKFQLVVCTALFLASSTVAAQQRPATRGNSHTPAATVELFNPVAFLSQVVAAVLRGETAKASLPRMSFAQPPAYAPLTADESLVIQFAPGREHHTIALVLAESQLRVKLAQDWSLRCELASRDEANADAELHVDLGLHFRFK